MRELHDVLRLFGEFVEMGKSERLLREEDFQGLGSTEDECFIPDGTRLRLALLG